MSGDKITVGIVWYGEIQVMVPEKFDRESYADGIAQAVAETCRLLAPQTQGARFHPALGVGGYLQ